MLCPYLAVGMNLLLMSVSCLKSQQKRTLLSSFFINLYFESSRWVSLRSHARGRRVRQFMVSFLSPSVCLCHSFSLFAMRTVFKTTYLSFLSWVRLPVSAFIMKMSNKFFSRWPSFVLLPDRKNFLPTRVRTGPGLVFREIGSSTSFRSIQEKSSKQQSFSDKAIFPTMSYSIVGRSRSHDSRSLKKQLYSFFEIGFSCVVPWIQFPAWWHWQPRPYLYQYQSSSNRGLIDMEVLS